MPITLHSLEKNLGLTPSYKNEKQLQQLSAWCKEHISQDIRYTGTQDEQYQQYYALAKKFLEDFLPKITGDLKTPLFGTLTTLAYAVQQGYHVFLKQQNISPELINVPDANSMTLLHKSAVNGFAHTTDTLLAKGANPHLVNAQKKSPLQLALMLPMSYEEDLIDAKKRIFRTLVKTAPQMLAKQDKDEQCILHFIRDEFVDLAQESLAKEPTLALIKNKESLFPIHTAILNNQEKITKLLLSMKNVSGLEDGHRQNALHYAASYGNKETLKLCIAASSDINKSDNESKTPLILAVEHNNTDAVKCLLAHHAEVNIKDAEGQTALFYAQARNNQPLEDLLSKAGATNSSSLKY